VEFGFVFGRNIWKQQQKKTFRSLFLLVLHVLVGDIRCCCVASLVDEQANDGQENNTNHGGGNNNRNDCTS
jgi:hypothetical protein